MFVEEYCGKCIRCSCGCLVDFFDTDTGVRFTPGGIRKGASGHNVTFIHPKGNEASPIGGAGVLIELVQAPPDVVAALKK